ncbi:MAG: (4Fe-4S)-binding protein, partial [Gemmatimonadota bacterium]
IVVTFDPTLCIHSAICLRSLPEVFDVNERRWIQPEKADAAAVAAAVAKCPSGALQARRLGERPAAAASANGEVTVTVRQNGPLIVRGRVVVERENGEVVEKATCSFCRCGGTKNAPFCDGTHNSNGFRSPS